MAGDQQEPVVVDRLVTRVSVDRLLLTVALPRSIGSWLARAGGLVLERGR